MGSDSYNFSEVYGKIVLVQKIEDLDALVPDMNNKFQRGIITHIGHLPEEYKTLSIGDKVFFKNPSWSSSIRNGKNFFEVVNVEDIILKIGEK